MVSKREIRKRSNLGGLEDGGQNGQTGEQEAKRAGERRGMGEAERGEARESCRLGGRVEQ